MTIKDYVKAERRNTHVLVSLSGASGSGKTYSACELATGLCGGEPFYMLDTEAGRGLHYADLFEFEHGELTPPFTPARYLEAIQKAEARGFRAVVVDSASHEWEGDGGVVEMAGKSNTAGPGAWKEPKLAHKRMMRGLLQARTHLIFCLRAEEKLDMSEKDNRGKVIVRNAGWQPIAEKRFIYEMTISFTFDPTAPGIVTFDLPHKVQDQHRMAFPPGQHIGREGGAVLGTWAAGHEIETPDKALWDQARRIAQNGRDALRAFTADLPESDRAKLRPIGSELNRTAREATRNQEFVSGEGDEGPAGNGSNRQGSA